MKFPDIEIQNVGVWHSPKQNIVTKPRFVLRYEIECFISNSGKCYVDGEEYSIKKNSFLFVKPGQIRNSKLPFSSRFIYFYATKSEMLFDNLINDINTYIEPNNKISHIMDVIVENYNNKSEQNQLFIYAKLIELLYELKEAGLCDDNKSSVKKTNAQNAIYKSICFMKDNINRKISIKEIADVAGYSPQHFNVLFKQLTRKTPYEYLIMLKLQAAKWMLVNNSNTEEIANDLGFASASHFCETFRKNIGMTPMTFLRKESYCGYEYENYRKTCKSNP